MITVWFTFVGIWVTHFIHDGRKLFFTSYFRAEWSSKHFMDCFHFKRKTIFFSFYNRGGFHRDPRQIIQYKDLDAPDDAEAFWTAWYDQLLCLTYNISTVKPEANQTNIQPRNADTCSCIYFYLLSFPCNILCFHLWNDSSFVEI